jgi:hypothetical protein
MEPDRDARVRLVKVGEQPLAALTGPLLRARGGGGAFCQNGVRCEKAVWLSASLLHSCSECRAFGLFHNKRTRCRIVSVLTRSGHRACA